MAAVRAKVANVTAGNALEVKVEVGMTEMAAGAVAVGALAMAMAVEVE